MAKRKRYTDEFRASAVLMLEAAGYPDTLGALAKVSEKLKVPHPTLSRWARAVSNPPPNEVVHKKRGDLLEDLTDLLDLHIQTAKESVKDAEHNHIMTGIGILFDKRQLLSGGATENVDTRVLIKYDNN